MFSDLTPGEITAFLAISANLVALGRSLQKLNAVEKNQGDMAAQITALDAHVRNGITSRLAKHSGELDVLEHELNAVKNTIVATERNIMHNCDLRHEPTAKAKP